MVKAFVVSLVLTCVALVAAIIASALRYWRYSSLVVNDQDCRGTFVRYWGLWQTCSGCYGAPSRHECVKISKDIFPADEHQDIYQSIEACRGLMIVGILLIAASIPLFIKVMSKRVAAACVVVGGICCLIAAIVYGVKLYGPLTIDDKKHTHLHAGFGLALTAGFLTFMAGFAMTVSSGSSGYYSL